MLFPDPQTCREETKVYDANKNLTVTQPDLLVLLLRLVHLTMFMVFYYFILVNFIDSEFLTILPKQILQI